MNRKKWKLSVLLLCCMLYTACDLPADRRSEQEAETISPSLVAEPMDVEKADETETMQAETPAEAEDETMQAETPAEAEDETMQAETPAEAEDETMQAEAPVGAKDETMQAETPAEAKDEGMQKQQTTEPEILHFIDAWDEWHDAQIDPRVERHDYNWDCLRNTEEGIFYENDPRYVMRRGVDVSNHQGEIDWKRVKAAGYDFVFIRLGYRGYGQSGSLMVDKRFRDNVQNAREAGLDAGVYLFSQAISEEEAAEEARLVIEELSDLAIDLPVVYDPELIRDETARTDDVTGEQFTKNTVLFCEMMEEAGYQPMIYSNMVWEAFLFDMNELQKYPFWYADYEPIPQTPYQFSYWQYSESGTVDGISGKVDLNVQFIPVQGKE